MTSANDARRPAATEEPIGDQNKGGSATEVAEERSQWDNQLQFILTALGLAVGLGNVWKFPAVAYENGGICVSQENSRLCSDNGTYFFNGTCVAVANQWVKQPAEEFFVNYITTRSEDINTIGGIIWPVAISLVIMWLLAALALIKGINIIGKLAYITVPLPYLVVLILFFRGITLDGAMKGVKFYLFNPDWEKLTKAKTWGNALTQFIFSMNIGYGWLISLSSYSKLCNNHFRDTLIVIIGDTTMSLIGGIAAFSILGYLSVQLGKPIQDLVATGTSLAFIVYPEAMKTMWGRCLWEFLFFIMLFFLGVSTEIALIETLTGCVYDVFPKTKKYSWAVTTSICGIGFALGAVMVTHSGWYWFTLYSDYSGITNCLVTAIEILIFSVYGWDNIKLDLVEMRGSPRFQGIKRWFGPQSPLFAVFWATLCPVLALTVMVISFEKASDVKIKLDKDVFGKDQCYFFPTWATIFGWCLNIVQAIPILVFFVYRYLENRRIGRPFHYLLRPNSELPSCKRYNKKLDMTPPDEFVKEDNV